MTIYDSGWFRMGAYGCRWVWVGVGACGWVWWGAGPPGRQEKVYSETQVIAQTMFWHYSMAGEIS